MIFAHTEMGKSMRVEGGVRLVRRSFFEDEKKVEMQFL